MAEHTPVLLEATLEYLEPERGGWFVDATLGAGGHAEALLERGEQVRLIGIDRDPQALELASARLQRFGERVRLYCRRFDELPAILAEEGRGRVAGVLADLGVSSMQLDRAERGFSFRRDGALDMRMGPDASISAATIVNEYSEGELVRILRDYGEERHARRIARAIVDARREGPIETTTQLRDLVHAATPPSRSRHRLRRIDSATRTFQALRIEVNRELEGLEQFVDQSIGMLEEGGRLVVISYHSLEDRIVKGALRTAAIGEIDPITGRPRAETRLIELLTRKPLRPSDREIRLNPRSRSARLRAARRI